MAPLSNLGLRCQILSAGELRLAGAGPFDVEARAGLWSERQRAAVVIQRKLRLPDVIEADREVVSKVGVVRCCGKRLEILLLRLAPAPLLCELVAEREMQLVRARV